MIDGDDEDHSNIGAVGDGAVRPTTTTTSKYSDTATNAIINAHPVQSKATIRFECGSMPVNYYRACLWRATRGLGNAEDQACVTAYGNQGVTGVISSSRCNDGSQGVGSHCSSDLHCNLLLLPLRQWRCRWWPRTQGLLARQQ
jgi:hypothetical protein